MGYLYPYRLQRLSYVGGWLSCRSISWSVLYPVHPNTEDTAIFLRAYLAPIAIERSRQRRPTQQHCGQSLDPAQDQLHFGSSSNEGYLALPALPTLSSTPSTNNALTYLLFPFLNDGESCLFCSLLVRF